MSTKLPVEEVVSLLIESGYIPFPRPAVIASIPFDFPAVFASEDTGPGIVVVVDTVEETDKRMLQKLVAFARALDVAQSRRSVTIVIVGPTPASPVTDELSRLGRVLVVTIDGDRDSEEQIRDVLASLLPLVVPPLASALNDPFIPITDWLDQPGNDELRSLVEAATFGDKAVVSALARALESAIGGPGGGS